MCDGDLCIAAPGPVDAGVNAKPTDGVNASIGTDGPASGADGTAGSGGSADADSPSLNRILNGDFSDGLSYWHVTDSSGYPVSTGAVQDGAYCIDGESKGLNVGWPIAVDDAICLQAGGRYRVSFRLKASGPLAMPIAVKVGQVSSPYTAVFTTPPFNVLTEWHTYSYEFTADGTNVGAGVVFIVKPSEGSVFCVDDVSLTLQGPDRTSSCARR
jgi:hypothetical protein